MKPILTTVLTFALLSFAPAIGFAQEENSGDSLGTSGMTPPRSVFAVSNIPIDVSATSAAAARNQAIAQARRLAFSQVFQKMVAIEDWSLEPALTNSELAALVSAVDVRGEKSSQTRYVAELTVTFEDEAVLTLFKRLGVTYTDSETPPIVLLPVAHYAGFDMLWSQDNVWRMAWEASPTRAQSLVRYDLLSSHPIHTSRVSAIGVKDATPEALIALLRDEKASDIVIAYAQVTYSLDTGRYTGRFDIRRGPQQGAFMNFAIAQRSDESAPDMLERAIVRIDQELSSLWKRQLLVEYAQAKDVTIKAAFETPQDWRSILGAIGKARRLRSVSVTGLQMSSADLNARFFGDFQPLAASLASQSVMLERDRDTAWRVRVMTQDERASLQMEALGNAAEGYVDPLQDGASPRDALGPVSADIDVAPWEIGRPPAPEVIETSPEPEAAFQP